MWSPYRVPANGWAARTAHFLLFCVGAHANLALRNLLLLHLPIPAFVLPSFDLFTCLASLQSGREGGSEAPNAYEQALAVCGKLP